MKKIVVLLSMLIACAPLAAQDGFIVKLWPDGPEEDNGMTEVANPDGTFHSVTDPYIQVFLPEKGKANGQAVVICPGGSYAGLAFQHEGVDVAKWMNGQGIAAMVFKYRMPNGHFEIPRKDVQRAIEIAKDNSSKWGYETTEVGVMGFSAGGHLASTAATHFTSEKNRPAFAILVYPVISMKETLTHADSRKNLIGPGYNAGLVNEFSNETRITDNTPPTFIVFSDDDRGVDPRNGTAFYNGLVANGVPAEIHIYPSGGHGYGWFESFKYKTELRTSLARWLEERRAQ